MSDKPDEKHWFWKFLLLPGPPWEAKRHPLYQRVIRFAKKYYAHDEAKEARVGDTVRIVSTRPLSRLKRWRLKEVIARSTRVA